MPSHWQRRRGVFQRLHAFAVPHHPGQGLRCATQRPLPSSPPNGRAGGRVEQGGNGGLLARDAWNRSVVARERLMRGFGRVPASRYARWGGTTDPGPGLAGGFRSLASPGFAEQITQPAAVIGRSRRPRSIAITTITERDEG